MRSGLARTFHMVPILVWALAVGCGSPLSPVGPALDRSAAPAPPAPPTAPAAKASIASLVIEDASAIVWRLPSGLVVYEFEFLLREFGGRSGATITRVVAYKPDEPQEVIGSTDASCWGDDRIIRVPPGGTIDTFYTDAAWKLPYCNPGAGLAPPVVSEFPIEVFFVDDEGNAGSKRGTITTFRFR